MSNIKQVVYTNDTGFIDSSDYNVQAQHTIVVGMNVNESRYKTDGVADNVQIQNAIDDLNALGGGHLLIKNGNYQIIQEVILAANITIEGQGEKTVLDGTLIPTSLGGGLATSLRYIFKTLETPGKKDIHIKKIKFIGRYTDGTGIDFGLTPSIGGILVNYTTNVSVSDCIFIETHNAATFGIGSTSYGPYGPATNNTTNVLFKNNYCENVWGGLQCYLCSDVVWDGNFFKNVGDDCCAFLNVTETPIRNAICVNNVFVNDNYFNSNGVQNRGILFKTDEGVTPGLNNIQNIVVSNNTITQAFRGIMVSSTNGAVISNNTITDSAESAIRVETEMTDLIIDNNIIKNSNTTNAANEAAILIPLSDRIKITNNKIYGNNTVGQRAIYLISGTSNVIIDNNEFINYGGNIVWSTPSSNISVKNNTFINSSNSNYDILLETCTNNIEISNNKIEGATLTRPVLVTGATKVIFEGNQINASNRGVLLDAGTTNAIETYIIRNNLLANFTGSLSDGEACIRIASTTATAHKHIDISNNQITDNNNLYYLGVSIRLSSVLKVLKLVGNIITGNKYGVGINPNTGTPAITYSIIANNMLSQNVTYNLNTFATVLSNPINANNHTA